MGLVLGTSQIFEPESSWDFIENKQDSVSLAGFASSLV